MAVTWSTRWNWDTQLGTAGDWDLAGLDELDNVGGLAADDPIGTVVILTLFTDARIPDHMLAQYGFSKAEQKEWHGNTFGHEEGEWPLGSWLWVLRRAPLTLETARLAEHFAAIALQPMVRRKIVPGFEIRSEIDKIRGMITLYVRVAGQGRMYVADLYATR